MDNALIPQTSSYEYDGLKVSLTTQGHTIGEVLEAVKYVIVGQGYYREGNLEFVKEDDSES